MCITLCYWQFFKELLYVTRTESGGYLREPTYIGQVTREFTTMLLRVLQRLVLCHLSVRPSGARRSQLISVYESSMDHVSLSDMFGYAKHEVSILLVPLSVKTCKGIHILTMQSDTIVG